MMYTSSQWHVVSILPEGADDLEFCLGQGWDILKHSEGPVPVFQKRTLSEWNTGGVVLV